MWVMDYACVNGTDIHVCNEPSGFGEAISKCIGNATGIFTVQPLPKAECHSLHSNQINRSQTVIRSGHKHYTGFYEELIQFLFPMFATLYEARKQAPDFFASLGNHTRQEGTGLDDGRLSMDLLAPVRKTTVLAITNVTFGNFSQLEQEMFGAPVKQVGKLLQLNQL
jgi:hypothetical protein